MTAQLNDGTASVAVVRTITTTFRYLPNITGAPIPSRLSPASIPQGSTPVIQLSLTNLLPLDTVNGQPSAASWAATLTLPDGSASLPLTVVATSSDFVSTSLRLSAASGCYTAGNWTLSLSAPGGTNQMVVLSVAVVPYPSPNWVSYYPADGLASQSTSGPNPTSRIVYRVCICVCVHLIVRGVFARARVCVSPCISPMWAVSELACVGPCLVV